MDREQIDNLKRVAAHLRCAARRIGEHVDSSIPPGYVTLDELDAELDDYTEDSKQSIKRGLRQTDGEDLGSFAQYAFSPPDEVVGALRHTTEYATPGYPLTRDTLAATVRQLSHAYELLYCAANWEYPDAPTMAELTGENIDLHGYAHITAAKVEEVFGCRPEIQ